MLSRAARDALLGAWEAKHEACVARNEWESINAGEEGSPQVIEQGLERVR